MVGVAKLRVGGGGGVLKTTMRLTSETRAGVGEWRRGEGEARYRNRDVKNSQGVRKLKGAGGSRVGGREPTSIITKNI
jgi:hypothetical protein